MTFTYSGGVITQANEAGKSITAVADGGSNELDLTVTSHGYSAGDLVVVTGTTSYNGTYIVSSSVDINTVAIPDTDIAGNQNAFGSTETGTIARADKDLSGLSGLTGVTTTTSSPDGTQNSQIIYQINSSTQLKINGEVLHDPDREMLIIEGEAESQTASPFYVTSSGVYNYGLVRTSGSVTGYSIGTGITLTNNAANFFNKDIIYVLGKWNWNGGIIKTSGTITIGNGGTLTCNDGTILNASDSIDSQLRIEASSASNSNKININRLKYDGLSKPSRIFTTYGFGTLSPVLVNATVQPWNANVPAALVFTNFDNENNLGTDYAFETETIYTYGQVSIYNLTRRLTTSEADATRHGYLRCYKNVDFSVYDLDGNAINYSYYAVDTNNGNRQIGPQSEDDTANITYSGINQTGNLNEDLLFEIIMNDTGVTTTDDRTDSNNTIEIYIIGYNESIGTVKPSILGLGSYDTATNLLPDLLITETTKATVDAYPTLDTTANVYDGLKSELYDNFAGETQVYIGKAGTQLDFDSGSATALIIDSTASAVRDYTGTTITVKSSTFTGGATGTGTVTIAGATGMNGGTFDNSGGVKYNSSNKTITNFTCSGDVDFSVGGAGTYTINGGSINSVTSTTAGVILNLTNGATINTNNSPANITINEQRSISITGIVSGSRLQIYNLTTATECCNQIIGGTSYSDTYNEGEDFTTGDNVRIRLAYQSGTTAYQEFETIVTATANGVNGLASQELDTIYNSYGVDGSTITELSWDGVNLQVDINDADNTTVIQRVGAWYHYYITTATGIADLFGGIIWDKLNEIQICTSCVDLQLDNTKATPLKITGGRIYRDDDTTIIASASNSIQIDYEPVYLADNDELRKHILNTQAIVMSKNNN